MKSRNERMPTGALYSAYQIGVTALTPLVAAGFLCSARGRRRYSERLGAWGEVGDVDWWFHGASVGEVQGILPLVNELQGANPDQTTLLSSTSPTGLDRGEGVFTRNRLLPFDAPWIVNRALTSVAPRHFVLAETELWPTLLVTLLQRGVPCSIVNGRISDYTFDRYRRARRLFSPLLERFSHVCVSSEEQRLRYIDLGCEATRVCVTGHTKYDLEPKASQRTVQEVLRRELVRGESQHLPTLVLGSIRPGEEGVWFGALEQAKREGLGYNVIVAPRHMEKVSFFSEALLKYGFSVSRLSEKGQADGSAGGVLLVDTMGRLEEVYSIADLAFVGATLVDIGGHNPLEPAMYGIPVVVGPYVSVIKDIVGEMRDSCGILEISDRGSVLDTLKRVVSADGALKEVGARGQSVWQRHRGSAKRVVSVLSHE
jgi:3-deoxy-D-manno-octulosonic-acid transferase